MPQAINPTFGPKHPIFFESLRDYLTFGVDYECNHKTLKKIFFYRFLEFFDIVFTVNLTVVKN